MFINGWVFLLGKILRSAYFSEVLFSISWPGTKFKSWQNLKKFSKEWSKKLCDLAWSHHIYGIFQSRQRSLSLVRWSFKQANPLVFFFHRARGWLEAKLPNMQTFPINSVLSNYNFLLPSISTHTFKNNIK